jgi:hypothetical protein
MLIDEHLGDTPEITHSQALAMPKIAKAPKVLIRTRAPGS